MNSYITTKDFNERLNAKPAKKSPKHTPQRYVPQSGSRSDKPRPSSRFISSIIHAIKWRQGGVKITRRQRAKLTNGATQLADNMVAFIRAAKTINLAKENPR